MPKGKQRADTEDRMTDYRAWRWNWGNGCYVNDIDQVEWRLHGGEITPVVALEMTQYDTNDRHPTSNYLSAILNRYENRDAQAESIKAFAKRLGVDAIIVLFRENLKEFWLYNLTLGEGWVHKDQAAYKTWLMNKGKQHD
jgi:hypothetical protein